MPSPAGPENGAARLVGGSTDPGGLWEYGRLEVLVNGLWTSVLESPTQFEDLGRRGALAACRSLGYAAGAQMLVGTSSPFPAPASIPRLLTDIVCDGTETSLTECDIYTVDDIDADARARIFEPDYDYRLDDKVGDYQIGAVALICTTPSGVSHFK